MSKIKDFLKNLFSIKNVQPLELKKDDVQPTVIKEEILTEPTIIEQEPIIKPKVVKVIKKPILIKKSDEQLKSNVNPKPKNNKKK